MLAACAGVPHTDDPIRAGGDDAAPIGAKGHRVNGTLVTRQAERLSAQRDIPNPNCSVFASGSEMIAAEVESHSMNGTAVTTQEEYLPPGRRLTM
jgi:hypothetical protein